VGGPEANQTRGRDRWYKIVVFYKYQQPFSLNSPPIKTDKRQALMSEKKRQKKDGQDTNKKNQAMRKNQEPLANTRKKEKPAAYGQGLPRNDVEESKRQ
jgi:hypothetical protein